MSIKTYRKIYRSNTGAIIPNKALGLAICLFVFFMHTALCTSLPKGVTTKSFKNPPNEFRIVQYQLTPGALKDYPEWGIGAYMGFFYKQLYKQGPKGPKKIGSLVDAAYKSKRKVWLADDWGYPSGMAGGRVVAENPDYEVRSLVMLTQKGSGTKPIEFSLPNNLHDIIYALLYPVNNGKIALNKAKALKFKKNKISASGLNGSWELRVFARYTRDKNVQAQSTMKQFGHTGRYPDMMNRKAMSRFIANMHEPIMKQIRSPSKKVEGFYCNEPNLMQTHWTGGKSPYACAPWSEELPKVFKDLHNYDITTILPCVFEGDDITARRARIHYRQAVAELFTDSFARQIRKWCKKKGVKSSGHYLLNDYLVQHVQGYGDLMKFVSEFDVPALDIPIPNPNQFNSFRYQQSRFFSSVTSWRERDSTIMLLDPIIGGYGMKRLSPDLPLLLNSVNMACFHGVNIFTSYLPRKPGPGAKGYTKEQYQFLNEYTGRLTQVLKGAQRNARVALYYPIAMFQADLKASNGSWSSINGKHAKRQNAWDHTEKALLNGDLEYMIVHPEGVLEAELEDGMMKIGRGQYHTLVIPAMDILPLAVAEKLTAFQKAGGKVLWVDKVPNLSEHQKNEKALKEALSGAVTTGLKQLVAVIPQSYSSDFSLSFSPDPKTLAVGRFHSKGKQVYLLVNRQQKDIIANVTGNGKVSVLDPSSGKISKLSLPAKLPLKAIRALMLLE